MPGSPTRTPRTPLPWRPTRTTWGAPSSKDVQPVKTVQGSQGNGEKHSPTARPCSTLTSSPTGVLLRQQLGADTRRELVSTLKIISNYMLSHADPGLFVSNEIKT